MATYITNAYGFNENGTAKIAQEMSYQIAKGMGIKELPYSGLNSLEVSEETLSEHIKALISYIQPGDVIINQFPSWNFINYDEEFVKQILNKGNVKLIQFVHDFPPLMYDVTRPWMSRYVSLLNQAHVLILPSQAMYEELRKHGLVNENYVLQEMWDQIFVDDLEKPEYSKDISFAGNPEKFALDKTWHFDKDLIVYNSFQDNQNTHLAYQGLVRSNELAYRLSKGGFGLVWASDKEWSQYYHWNCIFKLSTYLASGIPIIAPSYISSAKIIRENYLGILVDTLEEAIETVESMTKEEYQKYLNHIQDFRKLLVDGYFTKNLITQAMMALYRQDLPIHTEKIKKNAYILTNSDKLEQIEYLINNLPYIHFFIAAKTLVSDDLMTLASYDNVSVIPGIIDSLSEQILEVSDIYLDINHFNEVDHIVERASKKEIPVFAFENTAHSLSSAENYYIVNESTPEKLIEAIDYYLQTSTLPKKTSLNPRILSIEESLNYILTHKSSVARFGDGEMEIISGHSIAYQDYDPVLANELQTIISYQSNPNMLVCLSDVFENLDRYNDYAKQFWKNHINTYRDAYQNLCQAEWYGNTFISRPYIDLVDKEKSANYFTLIKQLWKDRDLLIVEGKNSRSGVGNDLFDNAGSIQRIICPPKNAFSSYQSIKETIEKYAKDRLVLLMLGPTAKVLAFHFKDSDIQAIDIGHIDSEYEWFKMGATSKVKLQHKHTAEHNYDEDIYLDEESSLYRSYQDQIIEIVN
ncbi:MULTISPECIES: SP_1767 family glycosyltransferase [Aerococcus]|uniref:SP_1767 family glycosyltransferase n=1 Tax=Aerococcus TaxID=1375 RepID=UPI000DCD0737|nr:SP_1767 family glycosyltransferase [Aerococcus urinae]RAV71604.1 SP_1767 family glycosyltransferase [Aerococcus urinae]RAW04988.1 SP_1767 family glycosyltransferase [Aerococcus urinae]